jgi:hypothetical protein
MILSGRARRHRELLTASANLLCKCRPEYLLHAPPRGPSARALACALSRREAFLVEPWREPPRRSEWPTAPTALPLSSRLGPPSSLLLLATTTAQAAELCIWPSLVSVRKAELGAQTGSMFVLAVTHRRRNGFAMCSFFLRPGLSAPPSRLLRLCLPTPMQLLRWRMWEMSSTRGPYPE